MRLLLALLVLAPLAAASYAPYPDPGAVPHYFASDCHATHAKRFVHDYVGILGEWGDLVEAAACELYAKTGAHVVLLTVAETGGETIESYALRLFERWGIGAADRHDGLLFLYVDHAAEFDGPAARVEVGYGLEGVVNSIVSAEALDQTIDARGRALGAGDAKPDATAYGLAVGAVFLLTTLDEAYVDGFPPPPVDPPFPWRFAAVVVVVFLALLLALAASSHSRRGWGYSRGSSEWATGLGALFVEAALRGAAGGLGGSFGGGRSGGGGGTGRF